MHALRIILKIAVGLAGLLFLVMGLQLIFVPTNIAAQFAVIPEGIQGLSTLRADIGSFFLCMGLFSLVALRSGSYSSILLCCVASLVGVAALGRLMGFILDGVVQDTVVPFVAEIVLVCIFLGLAYTSKSVADTTPSSNEPL